MPFLFVSCATDRGVEPDDITQKVLLRVPGMSHLSNARCVSTLFEL